MSHDSNLEAADIGPTTNVPASLIQDRIITIRGTQVLLDRDLAELYGVTTKALNQAVKRNAKRFPDSFMFRFTAVR